MKRFSIRDMLLAILIVGLAVSLYVTTRDNLHLKAENKALRDSAGLLNISDNTKINITAIPSASIYSQAWRIAVPKNSEHILRFVFAQSNIPCGANAQGQYPDPKKSPSMAFTIPPNDLDEFVFRIDLKNDPPRIDWAIDGLTGSSFDVEPAQAVWSQTMSGISVVAKNETVTCELGDRATLFTAIQRYDDAKKTWVNKTAANGVTLFIRSYPDLTQK